MAAPNGDSLKKAVQEAGAIADLMDRVRLALACGPEGVLQIGDALLGEGEGGAAALGEGADLRGEAGGRRGFGNPIHMLSCPFRGGVVRAAVHRPGDVSAR